MKCCIAYLFVICLGCCFSQPAMSENIKIEASLNNNLQRRGYDHGYTLRALWHVDVFNIGVGFKYLDGLSNDYNGVDNFQTDFIGLIDVYNDNKFSINLGAGFEGSSPKIEYSIGYNINKDITIKSGLRQVLSREFDDNYTDFTISFIYNLPTELGNTAVNNDHDDSYTIENLVLEHKDISYRFNDNDVDNESKVIVNNISMVSKGDLKCESEIYKCNSDTNLSLDLENPKIYTVVEGDWIYKIARKFGVSTQFIIDINNFVDINLIYPGQKIKISK
ncbi:LysM peptidoglycan-binding domain-containing protein [Vibrio parahaemolyticus]|nr:LysM peptidoglycan-binding domain-containing protein [Vibrio parahaemolyticus]